MKEQNFAKKEICVSIMQQLLPSQRQKNRGIVNCHKNGEG